MYRSPEQLRIKESVKRLMDLKATQGLMVDGPAISKENGHLFSASMSIDESMLEVLEDFFVSNRDIFPTKIETIQDLQKAYQVLRTLQKTSDTQALEMRVSKDDSNVVNKDGGNILNLIKFVNAFGKVTASSKVT
jgi:hypothetical protein